MDRNTAVMTWREVCGSDAVMASMPPTGRMLEDFARRIEASERERSCAILKTREGLIAAEAEKAAVSDPDEVSALRAMAWQLTVVEREIRGA